MARITVEDCLIQENNRFSLVQLASKRTKQILQGSTPRIADRRNKSVVTALREIAAGQVRFMTPQEAAEFEAQREAEIEAARAAGDAAQNRAAAILGSAIFTNGGPQAAALEQSIFSGGKGGDEGDDEE